MPGENASAAGGRPVERNRALQSAWYGEPLGDRIGRLLGTIGVSQAALAAALGISAPMLSQLISGARAKISNPAVLARLEAAELLAADGAFRALPVAERTARLDALREQYRTGSTIHTASAAAAAGHAGHEANGGPAGSGAPAGLPQHPDPAVAVQALLHAVASAAEIADAAQVLTAGHPALAEVLSVYGLGRTGDAREHYGRVVSGL